VVDGFVQRLGDRLPADASPVDFDRYFCGDVVVYRGQRALVGYVRYGCRNLAAETLRFWIAVL